MTYPKAKVLDAAHTAGEEIRATRKALVADWDARSWLYRAWQSVQFFGESRPDSYGWRDQQTANRLVFKATNAAENYIELTDYEVDVLTPYWKN
jgi:hypothetical protein